MSQTGNEPYVHSTLIRFIGCDLVLAGRCGFSRDLRRFLFIGGGFKILDVTETKMENNTVVAHSTCNHIFVEPPPPLKPPPTQVAILIIDGCRSAFVPTTWLGRGDDTVGNPHRAQLC